MTADIRPALRAFLLADPAVSAAVDGVRIFPIVMPQGEMRVSLVVNMISEVTNHVTIGASGLAMERLQIDAYAPTADAADSLARAVKDRIDGVAGVWTYGSSSPPASVTVQGVFADTARTEYQGDAKLFRVSRDFLIWFAER